MRIAISKYKSIALAGALAAVMVLTVIVYVQLNQEVAKPSESSSKVGNRAGVTSFRGSGIKGPSMDKESRRRRFENWVNLGAESFVTPADTSRSLSFKLKFPKLESLGPPSAVYVDKNQYKDDRTAHIYYGDPVDGIGVEANKFRKIDFQAWAGEQEKNKKAGILKADSVPFLVEVNGSQGWAGEPGYNIVGEEKSPRPGFVQWQEDNGVVYKVSGTYGPSGTSVKELLEIARSVSE